MMAASTITSQDFHLSSVRRPALLTAWVLGALRRLEGWLEWRENYLSSVYELSALNDRELADIGVARYDIRRISRESADIAFAARNR